MIQYQKTNLCANFEPPVTSLQNDVIFQKYGCDITLMTSLNFVKYFGGHQPAYQIWCSHDVRHWSLIGGIFAPRVKCVGQIPLVTLG